MIELTPAMAPKTAAFTSGLIGRQIAGFVDGRAWFSKTTIRSSGPMKVVRFSAYDPLMLDDFSSRLKTMRHDASSRDQTVVVLFENIDELTIMPGDISGIVFDGDTVKINLNLPAQQKLAALVTNNNQEGRHLTLDDWVVDEWRYIKRRGSWVLILNDFDQRAIDAVKLRDLKIADQ